MEDRWSMRWYGDCGDGGERKEVPSGGRGGKLRVVGEEKETWAVGGA